MCCCEYYYCLWAAEASTFSTLRRSLQRVLCGRRCLSVVNDPSSSVLRRYWSLEVSHCGLSLSLSLDRLYLPGNLGMSTLRRQPVRPRILLWTPIKFEWDGFGRPEKMVKASDVLKAKDGRFSGLMNIKFECWRLAWVGDEHSALPSATP